MFKETWTKYHLSQGLNVSPDEPVTGSIDLLDVGVALMGQTKGPGGTLLLAVLEDLENASIL